MKKLFLILILLTSVSAARAGEWTNADTAREVTYQVVAAMDWAQTRTIAKHPEQWQEYNPALGSHPSVGKVDAFFLAGGIIHYEISKALPQSWRTKWQYVSIGFEGAMVAHNVHVGIQMSF